MTRNLTSATALAALLAAAPAGAEVPDWLTGSWATSARLTAPDGAQIRIRCTIDAPEAQGDWTGTLGCATVQGRFEGRWQVTFAGDSAVGRVEFSGATADTLALEGSAAGDRVDLRAPDGQGLGFRPGPDGALIVAMDALGPQRLTGELTFAPR